MSAIIPYCRHHLGQRQSPHVQHLLEMSLGQAPKLADAGQVKASSPMLSGTAKYPRFGKRGAPQAFPSKLYEILEGENPDIVGWTKTGRGFEVREYVYIGLLAP